MGPIKGEGRHSERWLLRQLRDRTLGAVANATRHIGDTLERKHPPSKVGQAEARGPPQAVDMIEGVSSQRSDELRGNYFELNGARLFDRPDIKPRVGIAAGGTTCLTSEQGAA